ncbi:MAG TPA: hypothetical protein VM715_23530 [Candidatus Acidoferrum sp.]|jgi:hypothetical protein|nr:hypothetical protein [Candidatus Acidoferrum sp.]
MRAIFFGATLVLILVAPSIAQNLTHAEDASLKGTCRPKQQCPQNKVWQINQCVAPGSDAEHSGEIVCENQIKNGQISLKGNIEHFTGEFQWNGKPITIDFGEKPPKDNSIRKWTRDAKDLLNSGFPGMSEVEYKIDKCDSDYCITVIDGKTTPYGNILSRPVDGTGELVDSTGLTQLNSGTPAKQSNPIKIEFHDSLEKGK